ncbi:MAG: cell wall hydrolase [Rhodospirillales bacterium]|nr:cell wall hydrolase [Rhodospirillales bacterium]
MRADNTCGQGEISIADATFLLALFLWDEAAEESVRVREALASAVANQVRKWRRLAIEAGAVRGVDAGPARALLFVSCLDRDGQRDVQPPSLQDPVFASCRPIAGRAINGALRDPTGGAVRFHRLGASPAWAAEFEPGPLIGSHLFYYEAEQDGEMPVPAARCGLVAESGQSKVCTE